MRDDINNLFLHFLLGIGIIEKTILVFVMKKILSYFFIINLVLFGLTACETSDNSTGFYTGDALATKKTSQVEDVSVGKEQITKKETLAETNPIIIEESSEITEEELDYK